MKSGIYKILNLADGKFYIGRAFNLNARWRIHKHALRHNKHTNSYLQNAWNIYGEDCFVFETVEEIIDISIIIEREQFWIDNTECCNRDIGYNLNPSAVNSIGYKHTEEAISKIRNNSIRLKLKPPSSLGRKLSVETRDKIGKANSKPKSSTENMKKPKSEEHKRKLSEIAKNRKLSAETKAKISASLKGNKRAFGKRWSINKNINAVNTSELS